MNETVDNSKDASTCSVHCIGPSWNSQLQPITLQPCVLGHFSAKPIPETDTAATITYNCQLTVQMAPPGGPHFETDPFAPQYHQGRVLPASTSSARGGYLKRTAVDTYRRQARGGKGRIGMATRSEDVVEHLIVASTHSYLLVFTNKGRVYWLKIYEIPDAGSTGKGKHTSGLVNLQPDESVTAFLSVKEFTPDKFIVMVTKRGVIKKCELTEFDNPMSRGIIAIGLDDGDDLLAAKLTDGNNYIFLASHEGMAIRFKEDEVRAMGRPARGVRAMELEDGDYLVSFAVVEEEGLILTISENGYGKRTKLTEYRLTGRGRKGVINMKTTNKVGNVVGSLVVKEDSDLMIITKDGKIIRLESGEIRQAGRSTQGVRLVRMEEGDQVAAASVIPDSENGNGSAGGGDAQGDLPLQ